MGQGEHCSIHECSVCVPNGKELGLKMLLDDWGSCYERHMTGVRGHTERGSVLYIYES